MFKIITEGFDYIEHILLKNGEGVTFRLATEKDFPAVKKFMNSVSKRSLRMRFMAAINEISDQTVEMMCKGSLKEVACMLAFIGEGEDEKIIGIGNYIATGNGRVAEVSFLIADEYQGRGISSLLLERLAGVAMANGFIEFEAEVLPENSPMLHVFKNSGLKYHQVWGWEAVHIELPVNNGIAMWRRSELRERVATANSLIPVLKPQVVAVAGASRNNDSLGNIIFRNILNAGFSGTLYPINPQANSINGVKAYSSFSDLPEKPDLAILVVPAEKVYEVAENAISAGAKGLVVVSAGFAEAGEEGKKRQEKLVELVRSKGIRLLGPSCLGLINTNSEIRLNASLSNIFPLEGSAGFFSHSAALGLVILEYANKNGIGFSYFVSAGNRADISGNDLLQFWEDDSDTKFAILYLETFGNPRKFTRIARRMSYKKPILAVKSAKSKAGRAEAEKKSGFKSGSSEEVKTLFHQTGVVIADTLEELFEIALTLEYQPLPEGDKVTVIANSAGIATLFADASEANNLKIVDNGVINLGAFTTAEQYEETVYKALINEETDSLLVGYACVGNCDIHPIESAIHDGVLRAEKETGKQKPVLLCLMREGGALEINSAKFPGESRIYPTYIFPEAAAHSLGKIVDYVRFKNDPAGNLVWFEDVNSAEARELVNSILEKVDTKEFELEKEKAVKIFKYFNLPIVTDEKEKHIVISVKPDNLFGPIITAKTDDGQKSMRLTPLTEKDLREIRSEIGRNLNPKFDEIIGKVSQMIEELPWLWELEIKIFTEVCKISDNIKMILKKGKINRPEF